MAHVGMIHDAVKCSRYPRMGVVARLQVNSQSFGTHTRPAQPHEDIIPGGQIPMDLAHYGSGARCGVKKNLFSRLSLILDLRR